MSDFSFARVCCGPGFCRVEEQGAKEMKVLGIFLSLSKQECEQSIVLMSISTVGNSIIIPRQG